MEQLPANDLVTIQINISTTPLFQFIKEDGQTNAVPNTASADNLNGFTLYIDAALKYDSLSYVANQYIKNKKLHISEGLINQYIVFDHCEVYGDDKNQLQVKVDFSGSYDGTFTLTGTPIYNATDQRIEIQSLGYELTTDNLLLKAAKWIFHKKIMNELKKFTSISLTDYYHAITHNIDLMLNKEWRKGIETEEQIKELKVVSVQALPEHIAIRSYCNGSLTITINEANLAAST